MNDEAEAGGLALVFVLALILLIAAKGCCETHRGQHQDTLEAKENDYL